MVGNSCTSWKGELYMDYFPDVKTEQRTAGGGNQMRKMIMALLTVLSTLFVITPYASASLKIPDRVIRIEDSAFENDQSLFIVKLPDDLEYIGHRAFANSSLRRINIPDSVTKIEEDAFEGIPENATIIVNYGSTAYDAILTVNLSCVLIENGLEIWDKLDYIESVDDQGRLIVSINGIKGAQARNVFIGDLEIPGFLAGRRKISEIRIEEDAFRGYQSFYFPSGAFDCRLSLPDCVTFIGDRAFKGSIFTCDLILPKELKYIGEEAFATSRWINGKLKLPPSLEHLGDKAFYHVSTLTGNCVIPGSCKEIGNECFESCEGFEKLTLENGLERIGKGAFYACKGMTGNLEIPNTVKMIGEDAFARCAFNGDLVIPEGISVIESGVFASNLFDGVLSLPDTLTDIGTGAFERNAFSGSLLLPSNLKKIGSEAFNCCSGFIGSLEIPDSVTEIGSGAFENCNGFSGSLKISNSVTMIESSVFDNCTGFSGTLNIPDSVTEIGYYAFRNCTGFTGSLEIPDSVREIKAGAFLGCSGFNGPLTLGISIKKIEEKAFCDCGFTGDLQLPNGISVLGNGAFARCKRLDGTVTLSSRISNFNKDEEWFYSPFSLNEVLGVFEDCTSIRRVVIPNGIIVIAPKMFYGCTGLKQVEMGDSVEIIHRSAFDGCSGLIHVTISKKIRAINSYAFRDCKALTGVLDISGIEYLGEAYSPSGFYQIPSFGQFSNCPNLKGVILSDTGLQQSSVDSSNMYNRTFKAHGPQFTIYCREDSYTERICDFRGFKYENIYDVPFIGGLVTGVHGFGEPILLNGYYSDEKTILRLRATIISLELLETVQQIEEDINDNWAFYKLLNHKLHFENLPVGDYWLEVEVLLEDAEDYELIELSKFSIQKTKMRAWGIDGFTVPAGIYIQGTPFVPQGSLQANREVEMAMVLISTDRNEDRKYYNMIYPNSKIVGMTEVFSGFRMEELLPQTYQITIKLISGEETIVASQSSFRLYPSIGEISDEEAVEIIRFCENPNNMFLFSSYCGDYTDYLQKMNWTDSAAMIMCNVKDIVTEELSNFLFGGSGGGYAKSLYKKALLEMMSHFDEDAGIDLSNLKSFKEFFKNHFNEYSKMEGWGVTIMEETYKKEYVDYMMAHYRQYIEDYIENGLSSAGAEIIERGYKYIKDYVDQVKESMKALGRIKNVAKYGSDLVEIISDAIEDHKNGLMALATLADAYGGRIPEEMKEALEEIMDLYAEESMIVWKRIFEEVKTEVMSKAVKKAIDLAGETAFTALLGTSKFGYKISEFMMDKGSELIGIKEMADSDLDILTLGNLAIQTDLAYRKSIIKVRGGNGIEPDPEKADMSLGAINQVYYTFEACKYTLNELYAALEKDALSMLHYDLDAFNNYSEKQWLLKKVELKSE